MLTQHILLLLDINEMAKGGFYCEAAGNAAYFTPLLAVMVIKKKIASTKQDMFILWYFLTAL